MTKDRPEYFTIVFKGRMGSRNPFKTDNPFGEVVAVGIGDALGRQESIIELTHVATKARELTDSMIDDGVEQFELCDGGIENIPDLSAELSCAINRANGA